MNDIDRIYRALEDGVISFEGGHAIYTPKPLVENVLNNINLNGKILVMFNLEFVVSLIYTVKIDHKKITFYSDHENKSHFCSALGVKYINKLDHGMKFDVILANPPYNSAVGSKRKNAKNTNNSNIYFDFIKKTIGLASDSMSVIVPAAWMHNEEMSKLIIDAGLESIEWVDPAYFPGVGIRSGISLFKVIRGYTGPITIRKNGVVYTISRDSTLSFDDPIKFQIVKKARLRNRLDEELSKGPYTVPKGSKGSIERLLELDESYSKTQSNEHQTRVMIYTGGTIEPARYLYHRLDQTHPKYGVVLPTASDKHILGAARIIYPGEGVSDRLKVVYFDTEHEALNCVKYLESKLVKFIIDTTKHNDTVNTNKNSFGNISMLDFTREWSDLDIFNHFKLTSAEQDYINEKFK